MPSATFYINESDHRKITKTLKQIGTVQDILFKDTTDMMNPSIQVRTVGSGTETRFDIDANYCYLEQTGKYYYITDAEYNNGYYTLNLHVDVLMTYQKAILAQPAIIKRQTSLYNLWQQDDKFKTYEFTNVRTVGFNGGFSENVQNFLLAVVGRTSSSNN